MVTRYGDSPCCRKTERKINFHQFKVTMELIAAKKYGDDPEGLTKLHQALKLSKGPQSSSTVVSSLSIAFSVHPPVQGVVT